MRLEQRRFAAWHGLHVTGVEHGRVQRDVVRGVEARAKAR